MKPKSNAPTQKYESGSAITSPLKDVAKSGNVTTKRAGGT